MKLEDTFRSLEGKKEGALIVYITLGDPSIDESLSIAQALIDSGDIDVLELGIPFSDPIADGPVIQAAVDRALHAGMNTDVAFDLSRRLDKKIPVVYLTYYNIILQYGIERFIGECETSGISGLIVADLPFEEGAEVRAACRAHGIDYINIVTPNTPAGRMSEILRGASGFVYLVSTMGVTGARKDVSLTLKDVIGRTISRSNGVPVAVGFGISSPEQVKTVIGMGANGAIVGSAIVDRISKGASIEELQHFVRELKAVIRPISPAIIEK